MAEDFSQSLDIGKSLSRDKEVVGMSEKKADEEKKSKSSKKDEEDKETSEDIGEEEFEESNLGIYLFWAIVIIIAALVALWVFTDWKVCIQF